MGIVSTYKHRMSISFLDFVVKSPLCLFVQCPIVHVTAGRTGSNVFLSSWLSDWIYIHPSIGAFQCVCGSLERCLFNMLGHWVWFWFWKCLIGWWVGLLTLLTPSQLYMGWVSVCDEFCFVHFHKNTNMYLYPKFRILITNVFLILHFWLKGDAEDI